VREGGGASRELRALANRSRGKLLERFFKTGPGEYAAGDRFLGLTVPMVRSVARKHEALSLRDVARLLKSPWHEERLLALLILVHQYERGTPARRNAIYRLYLRSTPRINNWDLVDISAPRIVGAHLYGRARADLRRLARSPLLWDRRIAILATGFYIQRGEFAETLAIARLLVDDPHDLIHKAVGWMLREVGKRDRTIEEAFLREHAAHMPRTMLRYAIERFPAPLRAKYLAITYAD
jgi:3-methyladenine DNA glycosylase AlkD